MGARESNDDQDRPGLADYRVVFRQENSTDREGVMQTLLRCRVGDVLPGHFRDAADESIVPFTGRIVERRDTDLPYEALLVIEAHALEVDQPFEPVESPGAEELPPLGRPFDPIG